jgi:hypothetical protein
MGFIELLLDILQLSPALHPAPQVQHHVCSHIERHHQGACLVWTRMCVELPATQGSAQIVTGL